VGSEERILKSERSEEGEEEEEELSLEDVVADEEFIVELKSSNVYLQ